MPGTMGELFFPMIPFLAFCVLTNLVDVCGHESLPWTNCMRSTSRRSSPSHRHEYATFLYRLITAKYSLSKSLCGIISVRSDSLGFLSPLGSIVDGPHFDSPLVSQERC